MPFNESLSRKKMPPFTFWLMVGVCLQAKLLPADKVQLKVYSVSTHRLARYLDSTEQLLPLVRSTLLQEMGFSSGHVRLHNLV